MGEAGLRIRNDAGAFLRLEANMNMNVNPQRWWEGVEPPADPVLIAMKDILARVPVKSRNTIYRWIRDGRFPKARLYIGIRAYWFKHEFGAWLLMYPDK